MTVTWGIWTHMNPQFPKIDAFWEPLLRNRIDIVTPLKWLSEWPVGLKLVSNFWLIGPHHAKVTLVCSTQEQNVQHTRPWYGSEVGWFSCRSIPVAAQITDCYEGCTLSAADEPNMLCRLRDDFTDRLRLLRRPGFSSSSSPASLMGKSVLGDSGGPKKNQVFVQGGPPTS